MEAEQLIQEKEWAALTGEERAVVLPLAADEQEFNLLKKMLLVAAEQAEDVPPVSARVQHGLREAVEARRRRTVQWPRWTYAAAAALLVLALTGWLLLHQAARKPGRPATPDYVRHDQPARIDTSIKPTPAPPVVAKSAPPTTHAPAHKSSPGISAPSRLPDDQPVVAVARINTSVAANSRLFDLVAEAY